MTVIFNIASKVKAKTIWIKIRAALNWNIYEIAKLKHGKRE